jgi:hypothetical protein
MRSSTDYRRWDAGTVGSLPAEQLSATASPRAYNTAILPRVGGPLMIGPRPGVAFYGLASSSSTSGTVIGLAAYRWVNTTTPETDQHLIGLIKTGSSYTLWDVTNTTSLPTTATNVFVSADGEGLTTDLIKKIMLVEDFMPAWTFTGHTTNALFDLEIHGKNILKYAGKKGLLSKIHNSFTRKYINVHGFKGRDYPSSFAHMMHGYESKYYSYIVSKVYAQDAWGQLIGKYKYNGAQYKKLLENAKTISEQKNLETFLGRKPNNKKFIAGTKR